MSPIDPTASSSSAADTTAAAANATGNMASSDMFLKLLVAQIKNQDPLNPTDGTQFVSQLAQFSELEQVIGIRDNLAKITNVVTGGVADATSGASDPTSAIPAA
jgi:flagellar basal-body rod modification protein FlgD